MAASTIEKPVSLALPFAALGVAVVLFSPFSDLRIGAVTWQYPGLDATTLTSALFLPALAGLLGGLLLVAYGVVLLLRASP